MPDVKNNWPSFSKQEIRACQKVLESSNVNYWTGNLCKQFEKEFALFADTKYAISLSNGTVAIDLALQALNISKGDEVIVTSRSFIASVSSIINAGAKPIFADICRNSQNIKSSSIQELISKKTKAILCVHLAGFPCQMDKIIKLAKQNNLFVIEDCAQAHGAKFRGKSVGSFGDIGCWSFCQDKIMSTGGEGGMVTTSNKKLWDKMWSYKDHGKSYKEVHRKNHPDGFRWLHNSFGTNWRMIEMQAAIGLIQLKKISNWTKKRNQNQNAIWNACKNFKSLRVPKFNEKSWKYYHKGNVHAAYKCYVFIEENFLKDGWNRSRVLKEISKKNILCNTGSCSEIYLEKAFNGTNLKPKKRLKIAKELGETSLMFLVHPNQTNKEIIHTCRAINDVMKRATKN